MTLGLDTAHPRLQYSAQRPATRLRSTATSTAGARNGLGACDTTRSDIGPRYGWAIPTTWLVRACYTTRPSLRHGAMCTQAGPGYASGALDSVLTQCTVLSLCLRHCSRGFQKQKSNQIKSNKLFFKIFFNEIKEKI